MHGPINVKKKTFVNNVVHCLKKLKKIIMIWRFWRKEKCNRPLIRTRCLSTWWGRLVSQFSSFWNFGWLLQILHIMWVCINIFYITLFQIFIKCYCTLFLWWCALLVDHIASIIEWHASSLFTVRVSWAKVLSGSTGNAIISVLLILWANSCFLSVEIWVGF